ncbi:unnamed protein product, partial [Allacma fusca]
PIVKLPSGRPSTPVGPSEFVGAYSTPEADIHGGDVLYEEAEMLIKKDFEAHHNQVSDKLDDERFKVVAEECREGFKTSREVEVALKTRRQKLQARNPASSGNDSGNPATEDVKLPKLDWQHVLKMQYLVSSLQEEALAMVKTLTVSDENYAEAWELLKRRYHNTRLLINSVLKKFRDQSSLVREDGPALRKMIDTSLECTKSLKNLIFQVQHWYAILVYI